MANEKAGSTVNEQITDAVTQSNVKVVAESPAVALVTCIKRCTFLQDHV